MQKILIPLLFTFSALNASDVNIENLLSNIEIKSDCSTKTKLESSGISTIYTKSDLERMQAKTLKDVLKSIYPSGYSENRYALPDYNQIGTNHPFLSSNMKIFVNNQEVSAGLFGSGAVLYGNIDLGFVEHIEIYSGNTTYEYSNEPTLILVKLFTKNLRKYSGQKISAEANSIGGSTVSAYSLDEFDNNEWSYFNYLSFNDDVRTKYESHNTEISRDQNRKHFMGVFTKNSTFNNNFNNNNQLIIDAVTQKRNTFMDLSLDGTPQTNTMENDFLHVGYNGKEDNFDYLISYDMLNSKSNFLDDTPISNLWTSSLKTASKSSVISTELKYKYILENTKITSGIKYRVKNFKYDELIRNGSNTTTTGHTNQTIITPYIENQYTLNINNILNAGMSFQKVTNNNSVQNDNLFMYRLGHTYSKKGLVFKTIYSHLETSLDPYLVNSDNTFIIQGKKNPTIQNIILENISHEAVNNKYELIAGVSKIKNQLLPYSQLILDPLSLKIYERDLLDNYYETVTTYGGTLKWTHEYNKVDKLYLTAGKYQINNLPTTDKITSYTSTIRNLNTYGKFDIFNEIVYSRDNIDKKNFYDYSAGVIYHSTDDLSVAIKGTNLFNKSKTIDYKRLDISTLYSEKPSYETPLKISPIDKSIIITLEYAF